MSQIVAPAHIPIKPMLVNTLTLGRRAAARNNRG
jgi:hypothetical protein